MDMEALERKRKQVLGEITKVEEELLTYVRQWALYVEKVKVAWGGCVTVQIGKWEGQHKVELYFEEQDSLLRGISVSGYTRKTDSPDALNELVFAGKVASGELASFVGMVQMGLERIWRVTKEG